MCELSRVQDSTNGRKCLFCESPADSREHVVAEWLSKRMGIRGHGIRPAIFNSDSGIKMHGPIKPEQFRTRQVCASCNNGWMSNLEAEFQRHLGFLVEPTWPHLAEEMVKALRDEADFLIRWMIKTAVVFERVVPKGNSTVVPQDAREMAKTGALSKDFFLALGNIEVPGLSAQLTKGFPVWNGGVYHDYQIHQSGFNFGVYLNHLAIRLVRCPDAEPAVKTHLVADGHLPIVPFWIVPTSFKYACPVRHTYPTFDWFMDSIEIYTGYPRGPRLKAPTG